MCHLDPHLPEFDFSDLGFGESDFGVSDMFGPIDLDAEAEAIVDSYKSAIQQISAGDKASEVKDSIRVWCQCSLLF